MPDYRMHALELEQQPASAQGMELLSFLSMANHGSLQQGERVVVLSVSRSILNLFDICPFSGWTLKIVGVA